MKSGNDRVPNVLRWEANIFSKYLCPIPFTLGRKIYNWFTLISELETPAWKAQRGYRSKKLKLFVHVVGYHRRVNADSHILSHRQKTAFLKMYARSTVPAPHIYILCGNQILIKHHCDVVTWLWQGCVLDNRSCWHICR